MHLKILFTQNSAPVTDYITVVACELIVTKLRMLLVTKLFAETFSMTLPSIRRSRVAVV